MVNLSSRFQAATKQFKVFIIVSEFFYFYLTPKIKDYMRLIDKITVKGSSIPMRIYCFDLNVNAIETAYTVDIEEEKMKVVKEDQEESKLILQYLILNIS